MKLMLRGTRAWATKHSEKKSGKTNGKSIFDDADCAVANLL